jgi:hypothetical protein
MKRTVLPLAILIVIFIITVGTIISASPREKDDPTAVLTNTPVERATVEPTTKDLETATAAEVKIIQLTPKNSAGNYRHPGVAEDSKGNRLVIFRGTSGKAYDYVYCPKDGTWSTPKAIPNQPSLVTTNTANIRVDSTDRFHCAWEAAAKNAVYASFRDGVWTTPITISTKGKYDIYPGLAVRSNDDVLFTDTEILPRNKEIFIHVKGKNDSKFQTPFNLTRDKMASAESSIAVDSKDNSWVVWKSDYPLPGVEENLVVYLGMFLKNNKDGPIPWIVCSPNPGWSFFPKVAVNSEDKVMTLVSSAHTTNYVSRLYDPATKKLGELISLNIGLCKRPWHIFYSRLVSHGKDFYAAVMLPSRLLILMKFDEETNKWNTVAQVSNVNVEQWDMYSGYDHILIAWNSLKEPTSVFLTTVGVDPYSRIIIKSASNLTVVKKVERTFFHAYYLNELTWTANPDNTEKGINVVYQRIYRKLRSEDDSKWVQIAQVAGTVYKYDDSNNITAASDYVYSVTCVDDQEHESSVY